MAFGAEPMGTAPLGVSSPPSGPTTYIVTASATALAVVTCTDVVSFHLTLVATAIATATLAKLIKPSTFAATAVAVATNTKKVILSTCSAVASATASCVESYRTFVSGSATATAIATSSESFIAYVASTFALSKRLLCSIGRLLGMR